MRFRDLEQKFDYPVFWSNQVGKLFPEEEQSNINVQLSRWEKRGDLVRLKRGIYKFAEQEVDEMVVGGILYKPSYVSLETALHLQGLIPDIPGMVTSVTTVTSREFDNELGSFSYSKIKRSLFFGFEKVKDEKSQMYYQMAEPEKALLDWVYLRNIKDLEANRVDLSGLEKSKMVSWAEEYPNWIQEVVEL